MSFIIDDLSESPFLDPEYQASRGWPSTARQQAEDGDIHAQLYMGAVSSSTQWFEMAANQNNIFAMKEMSAFYWGKKDIPKLCQWAKKAISMYDDADNITKRNEIAKMMYGYGMFLLGPFEEGSSVLSLCLPENMQDVTEGLRWIERAADLGYSVAAVTLGNLFTNNNMHQKIDERPDEGIEWFKKGAKMGNGKSAYRLASAYATGVIPMNARLEQKWLEVAAKLGHVEAQQMLATPQKFSCIRKNFAKSLWSDLKRGKDLEVVLGTDETNNCSNPSCSRTDNEDKRFMSCSQCRSTKYCSKECQITRWKNCHKSECKHFQTQKEKEMIRQREWCATIVERCIVCEKKGNETIVLRFCAKCKVPKYCSIECQVIGWKNGHKDRCARNVAELREAQEILDACEGKEGN